MTSQKFIDNEMYTVFEFVYKLTVLVISASTVLFVWWLFIGIKKKKMNFCLYGDWQWRLWFWDPCFFSFDMSVVLDESRFSVSVCIIIICCYCSLWSVYCFCFLVQTFSLALIDIAKRFALIFTLKCFRTLFALLNIRVIHSVHTILN